MGKVRCLRILRDFIANESGATMIEYGLICCLVFLVIVAGVQNLSNSLQTNLYNLIAKL